MATEEEVAMISMAGKKDDTLNYDGKDDNTTDDIKQMQDDEDIHFIIMNIGHGQGFIPILDTADNLLQRIEDAGRAGSRDIEAGKQNLKDLLRPRSDPFVKVTADNNPDHSIITHVAWDCEDGNPKWAQFGRINIDPNNLPKIITIEAFDKSDEPDIPDAKYGSFELDCQANGVFESTGKIWREQCKIGDSLVRYPILCFSAKTCNF